MTHSDLVQIGARYMRRVLRCSPVVTEWFCAASDERPDVIGWRFGGARRHPEYDTLDSVLIECKTSREDFLRDLKKSSRHNVRSFGRYRYYLAPPGVICPDDDLPDKWGLLVYASRLVGCVAEPSFFPGHEVMQKEFILLRSIAQEVERKERRE
jgi:hypothetical protein